jgi:hypothetical protein
MSVLTEERFNSGTTYADFHRRLTEGGGIMQELLIAGEAGAAAAEIDFSPYLALERPLKVLALSEDWCGDCTDNLPIVDRIARETGKLDFRILARDENLDIDDHYLKSGVFRSIPVVIFMDEDYNEIGHMIERPDSVTELRKRRRAEVHAAHPEFGGIETPPDQLSDEVREARFAAELASREACRPEATAEVVRVFDAIVSGNK